jgi:hypothetical protein
MLMHDGNNSLKRMAESKDHLIGDIHEFHDSDYFLPCDFVDQFKDEVKSAGCSSHGADDAHDLVDEVSPPESMESQDNDDLGPMPRTGNWKAAASEDKKKMWGVFEEMGIFASACCHGLILWIVDMIRSGEL